MAQVDNQHRQTISGYRRPVTGGAVSSGGVGEGDILPRSIYMLMRLKLGHNWILYALPFTNNQPFAGRNYWNRLHRLVANCGRGRRREREKRGKHHNKIPSCCSCNFAPTAPYRPRCCVCAVNLCLLPAFPAGLACARACGNLIKILIAIHQ